MHAEISEALGRRKFVRALTSDRQHEILGPLSAAALWIGPEVEVADCRDAKDNRYLELAMAASAFVIVTGDEGLWMLDPWRGVRLCRAAAFLADIEPPG